MVVVADWIVDDDDDRDGGDDVKNVNDRDDDDGRLSQPREKVDWKRMLLSDDFHADTHLSRMEHCSVRSRSLDRSKTVIEIVNGNLNDDDDAAVKMQNQDGDARHLVQHMLDIQTIHLEKDKTLRI